MIAGIVFVLFFVPAFAMWPALSFALLPLLHTVHARAEHSLVENTVIDDAALHMKLSRRGHINGSRNSTYTGLGSDPINWHGNNMRCDSYFDDTDENMRASNFGQAYVEWLNHVGPNATIWIEDGYELEIFLQNVLEWYDPVSCGVGVRGCENTPNCDDILTRIQHREHARQILFVVRSAENLNKISNTVQEQSTLAEINVLAMAESIAHTFSWQHDESIPAKCSMYSNMIQAFITSVMLSFLAAAPLLAETLGPVGKGVQEAAITAGKSERVAAQLGRQAHRAALSQVSSKAPWTAAKVLKMTGLTLRRGWGHFSISGTKTSLASNAFLPIPNMASGPSLTNAICKHFPNPDKASEANWRMQLAKSLKDAGMAYRKEIQSGLSELNLYSRATPWLNLAGMEDSTEDTDLAVNVTGRFSSIFAEAIYSGSFVYMDNTERRAYINEPWTLEKAMTAHFQNAMISLLLKNNMCYIHCNVYDEANPPTTPCAPERAQRFVPEKGVICQPQCWQNWPIHQRNSEMFGIEELVKMSDKWDVTAVDFFNGSYHHWKRTRYGSGTGLMFPEVGDVLRGEQGNSSIGAAIPVAFSPQPIEDITQKPTGLKKSPPCIVGNELSNETQHFFDAINIRSWTGIDDYRGLALTCLNGFETDLVNPISTFLTMCQLGWHWPNHGNETLGIPLDKHHQLVNGSDVLCVPFVDEVRKQMRHTKNFGEATCAMVDTSISWLIYEQQRSYVNKPRKATVANRWSYQKAAHMWQRYQSCSAVYNYQPSVPAYPVRDGKSKTFSVAWVPYAEQFVPYRPRTCRGKDKKKKKPEESQR